MADDLPPLQCRTSRKSGALTYPEPLGPLRPVAGDRTFLLLLLINIVVNLLLFNATH